MNLAEYRSSNARLADFLPWAALVDEGLVLNKDGSFQRTAKFRGPDLDSAVPAELVAVAAVARADAEVEGCRNADKPGNGQSRDQKHGLHPQCPGLVDGAR